MSIYATFKDIKPKIAAKFVQAFLPESKKQYYLRPFHLTELDLDGIAGKMDILGSPVDPVLMVQHVTACFQTMAYCLATGYSVKTPFFSIKLRIPGEYDGSETHLPEGVHATVRIQVAEELMTFLKGVKVEPDGKLETEGLIGEALDEVTGQVDQVVTINNLLTVRGYGLKLESDDANKGVVGLYFDPEEEPFQPVKAEIIAVNEPRTLKVIAPEDLKPNRAYRLVVKTMSSARGSGNILKAVREVRSDFKVTAQ